MADINFDELHASWKRSLDTLVVALRGEESLVTPQHSMVADEQWDAASSRSAMQTSNWAKHVTRDSY